MTQQRERFDQYMNAPCSELPAKDGGRDDPHRMPFQEWGVPEEFLFWLWQAAEAAALERAAQLIEPTNPPNDWTDYARIRAECAADIRKLAAPVERGGE